MKTFICKNCGSDNVVRDAWAAWSPHENAWVIESVFDHAHCNDCDRETLLKEVELADHN
jgi:Fe-S cluster biosynthesis and repair protein YggX